jgi:hypothetical protein
MILICRAQRVRSTFTPRAMLTQDVDPVTVSRLWNHLAWCTLDPDQEASESVPDTWEICIEPAWNEMISLTNCLMHSEEHKAGEQENALECSLGWRRRRAYSPLPYASKTRESNICTQRDPPSSPPKVTPERTLWTSRIWTGHPGPRTIPHGEKPQGRQLRTLLWLGHAARTLFILSFN